MNSTFLLKRIRWNLLIAIGIVITIAMLAVGVVYAAATPGSNDGPTDTNPQSPLERADYGDLPNTYPNLTYYPTGAGHAPVGLIWLGSIIDYEDNGATEEHAGYSSGGDDYTDLSDEDGIFRDMTQPWIVGATVDLTVNVNGCTNNGPCYLNGWIDWNGNNSFNDPDDQIFDDEQIFNLTNTLPVTVSASYSQGSPVFARFRLCGAQGPTLDGGCNELGGHAPNGEVEDYWWNFGPNAVELVSIEANTNYVLPFALLVGALILLVCGGAILAFKRRQA